ncbi:MAG: DNA internalization-related competence protein ComEC/Rec2, partial [Proteobacteria bacterium]|nr:DNA internalization-related competence protein ComEC/Rec2 [Pseudomonadota bacterium]
MAIFLTIALFTLLFKKNLFPFFIISLFFPVGLLLWDGYGNLSSHPGNVKNYASDEKTIVEGVVTKKVEGIDKCRLIIEKTSVYEENHRIKVTGGIQLTIADPHIEIIPGDRIRFWAKLKKPRNFGNPGGFDYEGFLKDRGIYATAFMKDNRFIAAMGDGIRFWGFVYGLRDKIQGAIEKTSYDEAKGIIMAITLGSKGHMAEETVQSYRKAGLSHLLAISGLHMGIVAFFFYRLFRWALSRSESLLLHLVINKWAAILTLFPLTLYLITSGMSTSAIRAYIMVATFLFAVIIERESEIYNTLSLAALIILIAWPQALFDPAFLLSFTAVLSIIYMVPRLESLLFTPKKEENKKWLRKVCTFIIVSLTASLGTAPIIAYFFNEISTVGIISNLLVVPLLGFIAIPIASLAMFAAAANIPGATMLFTPVSLIASMSNEIITYISSFSFASTLLSPPSPFEIILYYLLLWAVFNIKKKWVLSTTLIIPLIFISSKTFEILSERSDQNLRVTFLSVGQGESTFIEFPKGKNMLIDGGGSYDNTFDIGKMVVRPYLLYEGVKEIDYLVLSHPHADHMNGLIHILKEFEIGEVWTTDEQTVDDNHKSFKDLLRKRNIHKKIIHDNSQ